MRDNGSERFITYPKHGKEMEDAYEETVTNTNKWGTYLDE